MTNSFSIKILGKKVTFSEGESYESVKKKFGDKNIKDLSPIFEKMDKNKDGKVNADELELLRNFCNKLDTIKKSKVDNNVSKGDIGKFKKQLKKDSEQIYSDLGMELQEKAEPTVQNQVQNEPVVKESGEKKEEQVVAQEQPAEVIAEEKPAPTVVKKAKPKQDSRAFDNAINTMISKIEGEDNDIEETFTNEYTVKKGDTLWGIAEKTLKQQGVEKPGNAQIMNRISEIMIASGRTNKSPNLLRAGETFKLPVSLDGSAPNATANNNTETSETENAEASNNTETSGTGNTAANEASSEGQTSVPVDTTPSSISVTSGVDLEGWTEATPEEGETLPEGVKKYTKGEGDEKETKFVRESEGVKVEASTLEELDEIPNITETVKAAPADETDESAKTRKDSNLAAIKDAIAKANGNIDVIKYFIEKLKSDDNIDRTSDEYKSLVKDLLRTRNTEIVEKLTTKEVEENGNTSISFDDFIFDKDEETFKLYAGMLQEIVKKEKAGIKLTENEHELKEVLLKGKSEAGTTIEADEENGIAEKYNYIDQDGNIHYFLNDIRGREWAITADDPRLLDEFSKEYNEITELTDETEKKTKLQELFKKYVNKNDKIMTQRLLSSFTEMLNASKDDIIEAIKNGDLSTANDEGVYTSYLTEDEQKEIHAELLNKIKEEFLSESNKGNLDYIAYFDRSLSRIDLVENDGTITEEEANELKQKLVETFFTVTTRTEGEGDDATEVKEYTFNPSRRPTKEEITTLLDKATEALLPEDVIEKMQKAVLEYSSYDDLGKYEYTNYLETHLPTKMLQEHYAKFLDDERFDIGKNPETAKEELLKWIDSVQPNIELVPFDKLKEKFGDVEFVKEHLGAQEEENGDINRKLTVLDIEITQDENGKFKTTFDIATTEYGVDFTKIIIEGDTEEEVLEKAKAYIELQNIMYEFKNKDNFDEAELKVNVDRLNEIITDENQSYTLKQKIACFVNSFDSNFRICIDDSVALNLLNLDDEIITPLITDTVRWGNNEDTSQNYPNTIEKIVEMAKDNNNNFKTRARDALIHLSKDKALEIYPYCKFTQKIEILKLYYNEITNLNVVVSKLITSTADRGVSGELAYIIIGKGLTLTKEASERFLNDTPHSAVFGFYRFKDNFYTTETQQDGSVKYVKHEIKDFTDALYDNINDTTFRKNKQIAAVKILASSDFSPKATATALIEYYKKAGKGLFEHIDGELDSTGVKDIMPLAEKVLKLCSNCQGTDEYKTLQNNINIYKTGSKKDCYEGNKDFESGDAEIFDYSIIALLIKAGYQVE